KDAVYEKMSVLMDEIKFTVNGEWRRYVPEIEMTDAQAKNLQDDLDYLMEVKAMDDELDQLRMSGDRSAQPLTITAVVPVAGLIIARFYVHAVNFTNALERWESRLKEIEGLRRLI